MYTQMNWSAHLPTEFNKALEKAVGFERMLDRLFTQPPASGGYPPYNLRKQEVETGETQYILEPVSYTHLTLPTNREV